MNKTICVIGGGSWGTAISSLLADKGFNIRLWVYEPELYRDILEKNENTIFLPGFKISKNISPTTDLQVAASNISTIVLATPSHVLRHMVSRLKGVISSDAQIVCVTKGIETNSLKLPSQMLADILPHDICRRACYLSGPTFAKEVVQKLPTAATIASKDHMCATHIQSLFNTDYFRTYTHPDVLGVELGGALKNVIAIGAGVSDGMGNGNNARSSLITRGLTEMVRLGTAIGADAITFMGLTGMGDLVLTCTGDLSRNRTVGLKLGQGMDIKTILGQMKMVAEGVRTTESAMGLAKRHGVELPIVNAVYSMLYEGERPEDAMKKLMSRGLKEEFGNIRLNPIR